MICILPEPTIVPEKPKVTFGHILSVPLMVSDPFELEQEPGQLDVAPEQKLAVIQSV
jgi:hypothetical protein